MASYFCCLARRLSLVALAGFCLAVGTAFAQQVPPSAYQAMRWRLIGPFRGGRAIAVAGVPGNPALFYFGAVDGGVWKTTDAGRVWRPLWTHEAVASIGAIAVADSDPSVIYAGTGEADIRSDLSLGGGMYKSTDAGKTWRNIGLRDTLQISKVIVDPANPNVVLVAALGHAYGPNPERGVFRSTDGGETWKKVLYKDANTGAIDICFDPTNSHIIYAALYNAHRVPWSTY
ncbi:MAG: VPS10 domain-containing protein, partial [Terriglobia bacterium]